MTRTWQSAARFARAIVCGLACSVGAARVQGQAPATAARFRLVRCGPHRDAACVATRLTLSPAASVGAPANARTNAHANAQWSAQLAGVAMVGPEQRVVSGAQQPDITPVFGAPVLPTSSLARVALSGAITLTTNDRVVVRVPVTWRPPLLALPAFVGVADTAALPDPVREALAAGAEPPGIRGLVALLLAIMAALLMVFVPRFAWPEHRESEEDLARQLAASRALLSTQELEQLRGKAPSEAKPRKPEEPTKETALLPRQQ
jgi:hypothetical protein